MAESEHIPIKSWANDDRPREKMISKGRQSLSDSELLAIILGSGSRGESAVQLSQRILQDYKNNLNELGRVSIKELTKKYKGVGEAKAINIIAALELGRRRSESTPLTKPMIKDSKSAYNVFKPILDDLPHEEFWIALCDRKNAVIHTQTIGRGGVSAVVVDVKIILKAAIEHLASMIVLCHNHPSGSVAPSREDKLITEKLREGAKLIDVTIADHIIIGNHTYYSFADEGLL